MDEVLGAERWHGEYACVQCGRFITKSELIGAYEQHFATGEIRVCQCGNVIQVNYRRVMYDAG